MISINTGKIKSITLPFSLWASLSSDDKSEVSIEVSFKSNSAIGPISKLTNVKINTQIIVKSEYKLNGIVEINTPIALSTFALSILETTEAAQLDTGAYQNTHKVVFPWCSSLEKYSIIKINTLNK